MNCRLQRTRRVWDDLHVEQWFDKIESVNELDSRRPLTDEAYGELAGVDSYANKVDPDSEVQPGGSGGGGKMKLGGDSGGFEIRKNREDTMTGPRQSLKAAELDGKRGDWVTLPNKVRLFIPEGSTVEAETKKLKDSGDGSKKPKDGGKDWALERLDLDGLSRAAKEGNRDAVYFHISKLYNERHEFHDKDKAMQLADELGISLPDDAKKRSVFGILTETGLAFAEKYGDRIDEILKDDPEAKRQRELDVQIEERRRANPPKKKFGRLDVPRERLEDVITNSKYLHLSKLPGTSGYLLAGDDSDGKQVNIYTGRWKDAEEMLSELRQISDGGVIAIKNEVRRNHLRRILGKALKAATDDPDIIGWFTTKTGQKIPIREGQTKDEALRERIRQWESQAEASPGNGKGPKKNRPAGSGDSDDDDIIITMRDYTAGSTRLHTATRDEGLTGGSWLPIEKTIWKTGDKKTGAKVYRRYSRNGQPVWIIAVTNNTGDFNDVTKEAFQGLLNEDGYPSTGTWTAKNGDVFNDTIFFFSGTETEARRFKNKYKQQAIIRVNEDGGTDYIE